MRTLVPHILGEFTTLAVCVLIFLSRQTSSMHTNFLERIKPIIPCKTAMLNMYLISSILAFNDLNCKITRFEAIQTCLQWETFLNLQWKILTSTLRALIKNPIKKSFYGKKKTINVLTAFFISHKSDVKTFFNWILNQCLKDTH